MARGECVCVYVCDASFCCLGKKCMSVCVGVCVLVYPYINWYTYAYIYIYIWVYACPQAWMVYVVGACVRAFGLPVFVMVDGCLCDGWVYLRVSKLGGFLYNRACCVFV